MAVLNQALFCSQEAQDAFILERLTVLERYLTKLLNQNSEMLTYNSKKEVMQDVAVAILQALPRLRPGGGAKAYITEVGKNCIRDIKNRHREETQRGVVSLFRSNSRDTTILEILDLLIEDHALLQMIVGGPDTMDNSSPWILQEGDTWKIRELYSALHRLPLVEQIEMKNLYHLDRFNPSPVQALKNNGLTKKGSSPRARREHAIKLLRKDEQLHNALSA